MEQYLTEIFDRIRAGQKENPSPVCPRCGRFTMRPKLEHNCRTRDKHADVYICVLCGTDEAARDAGPKNTMRLSAWQVVKAELEGKTFLDLLRSGKEFECDLIIGDSEMPATFVWDGENPLTVYGAEYYAALMESPYKILPNGNIEVFCDDYKIGEHFTLSAAGHISDSEYKKLFGQMELTRDDIAIDRELIVEKNGITAYIETWFDVDEKFGISTADDDDMTVNFYALYHPEQDTLRCYYIIRNSDKDTEHEYYPTLNEAQLIKTMLEEVCNNECGHDLLSLWNLEGESDSDSAPEIHFNGSIYCGKAGIDTLVEPWFDADEKLPFPIPQDADNSDVFFYALYNPDSDTMKYICMVEDSEGERRHEFILTEQEKMLLKNSMEALSQKENSCTLKAFWESKPRLGWFVTDDSCWQCCREISEKVYELIQVCKTGDKYAVAKGTINLDDYTAEQWEEHIELFGHDGFRGFISDYDNTFPMRIIAEYIFETYWLNHLLEETYDTFDDAARYVAGVVDCEIDLN